MIESKDYELIILVLVTLHDCSILDSVLSGVGVEHEVRHSVFAIAGDKILFHRSSVLRVVVIHVVVCVVCRSISSNGNRPLMVPGT